MAPADPLAAAEAGPEIALHVALRTAKAAGCAFVIGMAIGPLLVRWLKRLRTQETVEKSDSQRLAELSRPKRDTPTMGGLLFLPAVGGALALFGNLGNPYVLQALLGAVGFCLIGMIDDLLKLTRKAQAPGHSGISARGKMALQIGVSAALAYALLSSMKASAGDDAGRLARLLSVSVPFTAVSLDLSAGGGWPWAVFCTLVMVGASNAVNLTDGLDGLAPGCVVLAAAAFAVIAYAVGRSDVAAGVPIPHAPGTEEMSVVAAALAGACVAFLWFNAHPARVFLGDTGSLALGGLLGYIACATKQELVLPIVGGVFVAEALSVVVQVAWFKRTRRRIFRCAPLHHHFQFGGMHEVTIVTRFWIVAGLCSLAGLATLAVRR